MQTPLLDLFGVMGEETSFPFLILPCATSFLCACCLGTGAIRGVASPPAGPLHSAAAPGALFCLEWDSNRFLRFMKVGAVSVVLRASLILMCPMLSVDVRLHHEVDRSTGA